MSVDQLERLREALLPYGFKLLRLEWHGWNAQYRVRCRNGHEVSRSGSHLYYHLVTCPTCRDEESLRQLDQLARQAGGRCLSAKYAGRTARYQFVCREGHTFEKTAGNLQKGSWCVLCARAEHSKRMSDPDGMKRLRAVARNRGGKCLSTTYTKLSDRYRFQCAQGHEWETVGYEVTRGAWCRKCANARKSVAYRRADGLQAMQAHALKRGGICLATEYIGNDAYYRFRCGHGHEWDAQGAKIFRGSWCPRCQNKGNVYGIADMRRLAKARGGRCLSRAYQNAATKLEWMCAHGHRWQARPESIIAGRWCRICGRESLKLGIELMRTIAAERGGQCISTEYVNAGTKLEWECRIGHRWFAPPNAIRNGHWCRLCAYLEMTTNPKTIRKRRHLPVSIKGRLGPA
ncbi:hypothetical protein [Burkholderia pseudomallei]|uniref:hypothetical protein n=1 Tax=Burkholderia pseudomallei TaxID=28450 RepID=UPI00053817DD|nr:hypothetical protein [Burkholderia pseudomallei]KGV07343.1 hypothetical protein X895_2098 [Burkholderia pseudomallei MSHR4503]